MRSTHDNGKLSTHQCRDYLNRWWPQRTVDNIRIIKGIKNAQGALFDMYEDQYERFMDNFEHIFNSEGRRLEFVVEKCSELPEL
jgi:hypothetical protein